MEERGRGGGEVREQNKNKEQLTVRQPYCSLNLLRMH